MKVLIIGGTLFIGRELLGLLRARGHRITILHRKDIHSFGSDIGNIKADRNDTAQMKAILGEDNFDWIFDNVYDWERGTTAEMVAQSASACGGRLKRYVFMSSIAAYGGGTDRKEDQPLASPDFPDDYVANKANTERALLRMFLERGFPAVTLRPPFVYGPGNPFYREQFFWDRFRDGRTVILPSGGDRLMQFVLARDLAKACVLAAELEGTPGQAFNVAGPPVSQRELVAILARVAGVEAKTVSIPREELVAAGGQLKWPPFYFAQYYDMPTITEDTSKMRNVLQMEATPFEEGLREEFDWYLGQPASPQEYSFEDRLMAAYSG